jgi:uncharacterized protein GlcG (DUF336 family)
MENQKRKLVIDQIIENAARLLPGFLENPIDKGISDGNVSICIVDETGEVHGAMWGTDKLRHRGTFQTAWRKASQVWITGYPTGKYEELVFTNKIDHAKFGIQKPDFIGWEGGWPAEFDGGLHIAVAISGMRGEKDTELVKAAVEKAGGKIISK